jgi:hypothetical protein
LALSISSKYIFYLIGIPTHNHCLRNSAMSSKKLNFFALFIFLPFYFLQLLSFVLHL